MWPIRVHIPLNTPISVASCQNPCPSALHTTLRVTSLLLQVLWQVQDWAKAYIFWSAEKSPVNVLTLLFKHKQTNIEYMKYHQQLLLFKSQNEFWGRHYKHFLLLITLSYSGLFFWYWSVVREVVSLLEHRSEDRSPGSISDFATELLGRNRLKWTVSSSTAEVNCSS